MYLEAHNSSPYVSWHTILFYVPERFSQKHTVGHVLDDGLLGRHVLEPDGVSHLAGESQHGGGVLIVVHGVVIRP